MAKIKHGLSCLLMGLRRCAGTANLVWSAIRGSQIGPVHIRPQVFAPHGTSRRSLDTWAVLSRNRARTSAPLAQQWRWNAYVSGQILGRKGAAGKVLLKVHFRSINDSLIFVNSVS